MVSTDTNTDTQETSERTMAVFFLISGTGKTGTTWLGEALNHPKAGIVCLDEGKLAKPNPIRKRLSKYAALRNFWRTKREGHKWLQFLDKNVLGRNRWVVSAEYENEFGVGPRYSQYFKSMEARLRKFRAVGDSHSWDLRFIPDVDRHIKIDKIIHLVRNGIQNVNALATLNVSLFEDSPVIKRQIQPYMDMFDFTCSTSWEYWCFWWSINAKAPDWLRERLPDAEVEVFRLEDITSDPANLRDLLERLAPGSPDRISNLQDLLKKNDDRDFTGNRTPEEIWNQWSYQQKEVFLRICGPAMEHFGYPIP